MTPVSRLRPLSTRLAFSLLELLVTVAVLSILATICYPFFADAHIRTQVLKVRMDYNRISQALQTYFADYHDYPDIRYGLGGGRYPIDMLYELHPYLVPLPHNPWTGKMTYILDHQDGKVYVKETRKQFDYWIDTILLLQPLYGVPRPGWTVCSGGPVSESVGPNPISWYSPTNGTLSFGGFWMDSINRTNTR